MQAINALSLAPDVNDWLANSRQPRILHVFDQACNLINERREVLSIVTPQIGNGPFNLVLEDDVLFSEHLSLESPVSVFPTQLNLEDFIISIDNAKLWLPRADWEMLHARRDVILDELTKLQITHYQVRGLDMSLAKSARDYSTTSLQSLISNLSSSLANADLPSSLIASQKLSGLGIGLTPAGDDFILGAIYAAWIIHPPEITTILVKEVTNTAAALTTSLSAAWLRSAGRGEAGILWHDFFDTLISADSIAIQLSVEEILSIGHTSGADALAGFSGVFMAWAGVFRKDLHLKALR